MEIDSGTEPIGNLNHDGSVEAEDIDILFANLGSAATNFDLDGDGDVDGEDADHLVRTIMRRRFGYRRLSPGSHEL